MNLIQGGRFESGFYAGAVGSIVGEFGISRGNRNAQLAIASTLGGTASALGGGKFLNGAVSAAFALMFNNWMHTPQDPFLYAYSVSELEAGFGKSFIEKVISIYNSSNENLVNALNNGEISTDDLMTLLMNSGILNSDDFNFDLNPSQIRLIHFDRNGNLMQNLFQYSPSYYENDMDVPKILNPGFNTPIDIETPNGDIYKFVIEYQKTIYF